MKLLIRRGACSVFSVQGLGSSLAWLRAEGLGFRAGDLTSAQPAFYVPTIRNSWGKCKAVRPGPPARSKMRLHKSRTFLCLIFAFSSFFIFFWLAESGPARRRRRGQCSQLVSVPYSFPAPPQPQEVAIDRSGGTVPSAGPDPARTGRPRRAPGPSHTVGRPAVYYTHRSGQIYWYIPV